MSVPVVYQTAAQRDVEKAYRWYRKKSPASADRFLAQLEVFIARIGKMPEMYAIVRQQARLAPLRQFPYIVCYRVLTDRIEILAVYHGRRKASVWRKRLG